MKKGRAWYVQRDKANGLCQRSGNQIAAAVAVDVLTMFPYRAGISASFRQQKVVALPQVRESLDRKAVVFHKPGAWAAARRIGEDTAGSVALSAYY